MSKTREQDRVLHAIQALVESQLKVDAKVEIQGYFLGQGDDMKAYIEFRIPARTSRPDSVTHEPGIPLQKLTPDRAWPAAQWIIAQVRQYRPQWFLPAAPHAPL